MGGHGETNRDEPYVYEPWYKYGIAFLFFELAIAVGVSIYSISMGLSGNTVQFKKAAVHDKPAVAAKAPEAAEQGARTEEQIENGLEASAGGER